MKEVDISLTLDNLWEVMWYQAEATGGMENLYLLDDFEV